MSPRMSDLKPCPFCNSANINAASYIRDGSAVICRDCSATTRAFNPNSREKAASNWNRRAAIAAVEAEGWQLVPVEPTEAMLTAGFLSLGKGEDASVLERDVYRAMLAAAPKPVVTDGWQTMDSVPKENKK